MKINSKVKWSDFKIMVDAQTSSDYVKFQVSPENFLKYAIDDLRTQDVKGRINCLTNCKRAIDCQIDWIISYLGFDYLDFSENRYPNLNIYMNKVKEEGFSSDMPFKIKFIQTMGIAPMFLVSNIRKVRNKLEHEYKIPDIAECQEALELADLFINSTQNKMWDKKWTDFYIQSNSSTNLDIAISYKTFDTDTPYIEVRNRSNNKTENYTKFYPKQKEYLELLYIAIKHEFNMLPKFFGKDIEEMYINFKIEFC
ncbi:hypothetical protein [Marinilactibacillus psychrotolerans]|uniref:Uncharacterized protein n=1 Tax=Marinilactibacillus psychrotolerans TaxID=191770 RepID=A0ABW8ULQ3_9LACT